MEVLMTPHQRVFAVLTSIAVLALVLELVRRRRLREEYSWLWIATAVLMTGIVVWYRPLLYVTWLIGAVSPVTTLLLFASLFLLAIAVHYSIIISRLTTQLKNLAQAHALLAERLDAGDRRGA